MSLRAISDDNDEIRTLSDDNDEVRGISDDNDEIRGLADDNDEWRALGIRLDGYPYTYPFYYATGDARVLKDIE